MFQDTIVLYLNSICVLSISSAWEFVYFKLVSMLECETMNDETR